MKTQARVSTLIAKTLAITAIVASSLVVTTIQGEPAEAASSPGGVISRAEVIQRAQDWVSHPPGTYSQSGYSYEWSPGTMTYRRDCSGFVTMAWHMSSNRENTQSLYNYYTTKISRADLKPGDALDIPSAHMILFDRWIDKAAGTFWYYTFGGTYPQHLSANINGSTIDGRTGSAYYAIRYKNISDTATPPTTPQNCPLGYVCIYPGTDMNAVPSLKYYNYGTVNFVDQYGNKIIYNNQTGGAAARVYTGTHATGTATLISAGTWRTMDFTPLNSIKLSTS